MSYHLGRYAPPPATPVLPRELVTALDLPGAADHGTLRLPPPPTDAQRLAELPVVHRIAGARTPAGERWATYMDARGATSMWWGAAQEARSTHGLVRGLELRAALAAGHVAGIAATYAPGQLRVSMQRPFQLDDSIPLLGRRPPTSSYPSGHARQAYLAARIVARLDPHQAESAYAAAGDVARSRIYVGAHLPSDVAAGARLGVAVGDAVAGAVRVGRIAVPAAAIAGAGALALRARDDG